MRKSGENVPREVEAWLILAVSFWDRVESGSSVPVRVLGRYALHGEIASGGMATVHFARLLGVVGFAKTVAIKRLHPQLAKDPEFVSMFLDEARLAARIRHPNVVSTLDVVALHGELFLVMEYVQGESLRQLVRAAARAGEAIPAAIVGTVMVGSLHGLHAAHEASSERGEPLGIVHRDVSPQNILVGIDGVSRVLDFGVAKASGRVQTTRDGQLKGKLAYMSPEQLMGRGVTRATDIFAASIVLWEALTGKRLFGGESEGEVVKKVLDAQAEPPSSFVSGLPPGLDAIVLRGLARDPAARFATAREMARALERTLPLAPASDVGEYVEKMAGPALAQRAEQIAEIESGSPSIKSPGVVQGGPPASGSSWPSLVVPAAPARPSSTVRMASPEATVKLDPPVARAPMPPLPPSERSSISKAIGAIVSDSGARAPAVVEDEPTFLRVRRRLLTRVVVGAGVAACALLLLAGGVVLGDKRDVPAAHVASAAAPPIPLPSSVPAVPEPPPPAPTEPGVTASAATQPAPATPASAVVPPVAATPNRSAPSRPAPRHAGASCDPPFTVDANGFHHYKRECLR
jgi:serine/threonine-protein kinase